MSSFKRSQAMYVKKAYRVRNWRAHEQGLRARGSLTTWLSLTDEGKLANWDAPPARSGSRDAKRASASTARLDAS